MDKGARRLWLAAAGKIAQDDRRSGAEHARQIEVGDQPIEPVGALAEIHEEEDVSVR